MSNQRSILNLFSSVILLFYLVPNWTVSVSPKYSAKKGLEEESGPLSFDSFSTRRWGGIPPSGPYNHWSINLQEKQRTVHQTSKERLSLWTQDGQAVGGTQVLQWCAKGNTLKETLRVRMALLFPCWCGGAGPSWLSRYHQAANGPEHHQGKTHSSHHNVRDNSSWHVAFSEKNGPGRVRAARRVCCRRPTDVFQLLQIQPSFTWSCPHGEKTAGIHAPEKRGSMTNAGKSLWLRYHSHHVTRCLPS